MKFFLAAITLVLLLFVTVTETHAKVLPQARQATTTTVRSTSSGISISPKLRPDRKALVITFGNLQNAKTVSYTLYYTTNGQQEGAGGSLTLNGDKTAMRELLFGTCSKNVCRYHTNITNAKLEVTYTLTSGKKFLKRYRIKV